MKLPTVIDMTSAQALKNDILLHFYSGGQLDLDASEVVRLGTPGLQLLWSAMATFSAAGLGLKLINPSSGLLAAFEDAGLDFTNRFQTEAGTH
ncbi:STAS domain-containing protein [Asticcacaulis sp. MM231]|uniref:STAS domain-containing protein n=1 Tax=Asticcacaulis sp. MM231 TaxID=3157666 RepID=UPI0032D5AE4E